MSTAIRTRIEGDPSSIESTVDWLRGGLGPTVGDAAATVVNAISGTGPEWIGAAGDAFRAELAAHRGMADRISDGVRTTAGAFGRFAEELRAAQRTLTEIRTRAAAAALELTADHILPPGPVPPVPGELAEQASAAQRAAHRAAADLFAEYQRKVRAFRAAAEDVAEVVKKHYASARELVSRLSALDDLRDLAKLDDVAKLRDSRAYRFLRLGLERIAIADLALTAAENGWHILQGEPPGEVFVRSGAEELAFYLELAENDPRVAALFRALGVDDYDWDDLDDDAVELYRQLPPELRQALDSPFTQPRELAQAQLQLAEQGLDQVGVIADVAEGTVDGLQDKAEDVVDTGEDVGEGIVDSGDLVADTLLPGR